MRISTGILFFVSVLFVATPPAVQAQSEQKSDPIAIYREAGIDEGQANKIKALADSYERAQDDKAHQLIAYLKQLRAMSLSPDLDEKQILEIQSNMNKLQNEMALDRVHLLINIRKVLNKAQRNRLVTLMQNKSAPDNAINPPQ